MKPPADFTKFVEDAYPTFVRILETANPPGEEAQLSALMSKELTKIGASMYNDKTGNLIGSLGEGDHALLLGGHLDSVEPCRGIKVGRKGDIVTSAGDTILSADDGAGLFEILVAMQYLASKKIAHCPVDFLFTVGEEVGGIGVNAFDASSVRAKHGILLDRAASIGTFVIAAPYKRNFRVTFRGKPAHAFEAEKGISAIHMASAAVAQFPQGRIKDDLYANIGKIYGGDSVNQVPEYATIEGEVRAFNSLDAESLLEQYDRIIQSIQYQFAISEEASPEVSFEYTDRREGYHHDPTLPIIKLLMELHEKMDIETQTQITRACSDAGDLTAKGISTINYANGSNCVHTKDEWVDMKDVIQISWLMTQVLEEIGHKPEMLQS
ncbi:MAG: M20/M25/M40 family metallo-hydrolase [bacterium]|nr:M20/M25/M40 family metallo-hydrolase [bacterium]